MVVLVLNSNISMIGDTTTTTSERARAREADSMNINETVSEYWPELSRRWSSPALAVRYYKGDEEAVRELEYEVKAHEKLRARNRRPEQDRNTTTTSNVDLTYGAVDEINRLAREGKSMAEIQELTRPLANALEDTTKYAPDPIGFSEASIIRQIRTPKAGEEDHRARLMAEVGIATNDLKQPKLFERKKGQPGDFLTMTQADGWQPRFISEVVRPTA